MLDKGVQGVVGNFVLKTDPLPVCLCGFYVTTLCMEQLSALLFCGILKCFFIHLKNTSEHFNSSSSDSIPPQFLLDPNSETLADIHEKSSHVCCISCFHETRVVPHFGSCFDLLLECPESCAHLKFTNEPKTLSDIVQRPRLLQP